MKLFKNSVVIIALTAMTAQTMSFAAPLNLAQRPLNSGKPPAPNMVVSIDDSGSMREESCYDPATVYPSPLDSAELPIVVTYPTVPIDGWGVISTATADLSTFRDWNCGGMRFSTLLATNGRTLVEERQNIANFFSFYRTRMSKVKSALTRAFASSVLPDNSVRLAFQTLGGCTSFSGSNCKPRTSQAYTSDNRIRILDAAQRANFWNFQTRISPDFSTPLRETMVRAGEYFKTSGVQSPYASVPGTAEFPVLSCRRNYHVLLTDGQWNGGAGMNASGLDRSTFALPDGVTYTAIPPFRGNAGSGTLTTLSDIALHYWKTDLQPSMLNDVNPLIRVQGTSTAHGTAIAEYWNPINDPATWQHMTNFTIGVDLSDTLNPQGQFPAWGGSTYATNIGGYGAVLNGTRAWPTMNDFDDRTYDLWHAAVNSRGDFFSADNPASVEKAFRDIIQQILSAGSQGQTVGGSSPNVKAGDGVYRGSYGSDLSGSLAKTSVNVNGKELPGTIWEAGTLLRARNSNSRVILTHNGSAPSAFRWGSLSAAQQAALNSLNGVADTRGEARVDWLRGDITLELGQPGAGSPATSFRARGASGLGSIVNSAPVVVGKGSAGFADASYRSYVTGVSRTRTPVVYVGANDGMLHGFKDADGQEVMAYVPKGVYERLSDLTDIAYTSRFYVNGSPFSTDVFAGGSWRTLLGGIMSGGGKGLFVLDVSNPTAFSESNPAQSVLLDMSASDDADLGNIYGNAPTSSSTGQSLLFTKLQNGKNVLIVGNGVNSASEKPVLFVFLLDNLPAGGNWILNTHYFKLEPTGAGVAGSNGLSMPVPVDTDGDNLIDTIYAGDLKGNLWKFVADTSAPSGLKIANSGTPLFTGPPSGGKPQPITSAPTPYLHPLGGSMVIFGTGQLIQDSDPNNAQVQTIYGVWDKPGVTTTAGIGSLVAQTILTTFAGATNTFRNTSANKVDYAAGKRGWYINLPTGGERVVAGGQLLGRGVLIPTVIPATANGETCTPGVSPGFWMYFDAISGAAPQVALYDTNGDGKITAADQKNSGMSVNNGEAKPFISKAFDSVGGAGQPPPGLQGCGGRKPKITGTGNTAAPNLGSRCGRMGWTQLKE
jgi:type IV pilus assembly protein PilY1